jgi:hypothetical protein
VRKRLLPVVVALIAAIAVALAGLGSPNHSVRSADDAGTAGWSWDGWSWDGAPPADTTAAVPTDDLSG